MAHRPNLPTPIPPYTGYSYFHAAVTKSSSSDKDHRTHKVDNIYYLALFRKKFLNPVLGIVPFYRQENRSLERSVVYDRMLLFGYKCKYL